MDHKYKRIKEWISALMYVPRTREEFKEFLVGEGVSEEEKDSYLERYDKVMEMLREEE